MKKYLFAYILIACVFYGVIFYFRVHHIEYITKIIIPLFVFTALFFVLSTNRPVNRHTILLHLAFLLIFTGDVIINLTGHKELSIIPFALAHVLLTTYYIQEVGFIKQDFICLIPVLCLSSMVIFIVRKDIPDNVYLFPLIVYLGILGVMLWRAFCFFRSTQNRLKVWLIAAGSCLFYITDVLACLHTIYHQSLFIVIIWLTYPPALVLLSLMNVYKIFEPKHSNQED